MIDLHAPLADRDRRALETDLKHIGIEKPECFLPFYGGELLCGGVSELRLVLDACSYVHRKMVSHGYVSKRGDEFLLYASSALGSLPTVVSANGYATRCWTGRYYSVPRWEDLAILHLPAEKVHTFPRAFKKLNHMGQIDPAWFERSCGLRQSRRPVSPLWMAKRSLDKVLKR